MPKLVIHQEKVEDPQVLVDICPFGAMEEKDGKLSINAACIMCEERTSWSSRICRR